MVLIPYAIYFSVFFYPFSFIITELNCITSLCVDCRMMWAAGAVAAMSSITFPAVSALVSRNAESDQQGKDSLSVGIDTVVIFVLDVSL